jgi:hypothetical protein
MWQKAVTIATPTLTAIKVIIIICLDPETTIQTTHSQATTIAATTCSATTPAITPLTTPAVKATTYSAPTPTTHLPPTTTAVLTIHMAIEATLITVMGVITAIAITHLAAIKATPEIAVPTPICSVTIITATATATITYLIIITTTTIL